MDLDLHGRRFPEVNRGAKLGGNDMQATVFLLLVHREERVGIEGEGQTR